MAPHIYITAKRKVRRWLLRRLPSCKELAPVMSESLERSLTVRERVVLKLHLLVCNWCVWYLQQLRFMRATLRGRAAQISREETSPTTALSPEARERLKHSFNRKAQ